MSANFGLNPLQYEGVTALNPPTVIQALRAPSTSDINYPLGTIWDYTTNGVIYILANVVANSATWVAAGSGATGGVVTVTGDSGGALSPTGGNINLLGTANQITVTGAGSTETFSIPSTFIAPGSITATSGAITATNGNVVLGTAGNKIVIATGANASVGTSAAMTAGAVTVSTTACSATAKVFYCRNVTGGTTGNVSITAQDGTGFTLTSTSATETSTFNWWIINA